MSVESPQSPAYRPLPALNPTSLVSFSPRNIPTPVNLYPTLILRRAPRDNTAYGLSEPSQKSVVPVTFIRPDVLRGPENVPDGLGDDKIYTFFGLSQLLHTTKCHNLNEPMAE
ncbi:hypothetical protein L917_04915 [Phytophthora nicotianae]|uniref:Uncharacterized protein n=2 Tax=Phytophthora nicotianae TaxID=4792 RepID=W2LKF0_PHYNI|nr:hypothetical protein L917_04915 [Phytophthora nicotianae]ETO80179.1 hypothetical protein F444_05255 [Phytophthora nicotianae P1976]